MSRRTAGMLAAATLAGLVLFASALDGCGRNARQAGSRAAAPIDSSFSALAFQRGRSPLAVSVGSGRVIYARYCAICHGETGGGDGFNAYNVKSAYGVTPTAFSDSTFMAALRDSVALAAIRAGGPAVGKSAAMPPWGHTLSAGEQADVWHYARSLVSASHE